MNEMQLNLHTIIMKVGTKHTYKHLKFKHPELFSVIQAVEGKRFIERVYRVVYGIVSYPVCLQCSKEITKFRTFQKGYALFCSNKCVAQNRAHKDKKKQTSQEHYGTERPSQSKEVDDKRRETLKERYGTDSLADIRWRRNKAKK